MKKLTFIVMTLALVLGFTQCKKEQVDSQNEGNTVRITLDVNEGNKDSRAGVDPPHVNFIEHDTILVASDGKYVGYLVCNPDRGNSRMTDLLEQLGLESRLLSDAEPKEPENREIDWAGAYSRLKKRRQESIDFLKNSLS